uniref:Chaperone protein DnaJ n=1 Tax=Noccaea caerulescens TaxID=107243 RepID=A0A1J3IJG8_NOCCA
MGGEDSERDKDDRWKPPPQKTDLKLWGILAFTVIGATATTFAVHQLRRTFDWVYTQVGRSQSARNGTRGGSFRTSFQEESWRRYNKRMQEEYEEELERVERIRRMQSVFNRERNKFRRGFENWKENDPGANQYHQQFQRNDWYWKTESTYRNQRTNHQEPPKQTRVYPLSHHYSVLGLSRSRATPYTEAEIKKAFREKAMEFHPDQNQDNKDAAEAKFKEVLLSYEAIKEERKEV